ncbi:hypothetical protein [Mesorhizobium sp. M1322]|uniref:hypothetical protein n=1 Tax=Mesorhizobium sp. M1322 TaxID=2957081 RepID=UPI003339B142
MSIDLSLGRAYKWNVPINQELLWILNPRQKMLHRSDEVPQECRFQAPSARFFKVRKNPG